MSRVERIKAIMSRPAISLDLPETDLITALLAEVASSVVADSSRPPQHVSSQHLDPAPTHEPSQAPTRADQETVQEAAPQPTPVAAVPIAAATAAPFAPWASQQPILNPAADATIQSPARDTAGESIGKSPPTDVPPILPTTTDLPPSLAVEDQETPPSLESPMGPEPATRLRPTPLPAELALSSLRAFLALVNWENAVRLPEAPPVEAESTSSQQVESTPSPTAGQAQNLGVRTLAEFMTQVNWNNDPTFAAEVAARLRGLDARTESPSEAKSAAPPTELGSEMQVEKVLSSFNWD